MVAFSSSFRAASIASLPTDTSLTLLSRFETALSIRDRTSAETFEPCSSRLLRVEAIIASARFFRSTTSRRFLSSAAWASASAFILSISAELSPPEFSIRMSAFLPVFFSVAVTCRMPLASSANSTSICGIPRGAGGMSASSKLPSDRLSRANSRSPCKTWICTLVWLSDAVEKVSFLLVGMVVFRSMSLVITPPIVSTPSESGVTSSSSTSFTLPESTPP